MDLKKKTITGLKWSFIDNFANQIILFAFVIILARLLKPEEFGLIGMIGIFISVSTVFVYSGLGEALIRKGRVSVNDYSTVFVFNIVVSVTFYLILFFSSNRIADFFNEPELAKIVKLFCLILVIDALGFVPRTILTKNIDFKSQAKVSIISSITSGFVGIFLAFKGFGVWSLVVRTIIQSGIRAGLLWIYSKWHFGIRFSVKSFREMFGFSLKIMISALINQVYLNIYQLIIGKFYSSTQLGFFNRANQFQRLAGSQLDNTIQRVSYPVLSEMQNDQERLKRTYQNLIKGTMFLSFALLIGMAAIATQLILTLIGEKWAQSITYLRLICFAGILYPLHSLNLNILKIKGRSDLFLKLEIIKKILAVPAITAGILISIKAMIIVMIVNSFIACFINSYYSGRLINYPIKEQIVDILPSFLLTSIMGIVVFYIGNILHFRPGYELLIQISTGVIFILFFSQVCKLTVYFELKNVIMDFIKR